MYILKLNCYEILPVPGEIQPNITNLCSDPEMDHLLVQSKWLFRLMRSHNNVICIMFVRVIEYTCLIFSSVSFSLKIVYRHISGVWCALTPHICNTAWKLCANYGTVGWVLELLSLLLLSLSFRMIFVLVFVFVSLLFRSHFFINLVNCFEGHKSLGSLCSFETRPM